MKKINLLKLILSCALCFIISCISCEQIFAAAAPAAPPVHLPGSGLKRSTAFLKNLCDEPKKFARRDLPKRGEKAGGEHKSPAAPVAPGLPVIDNSIIKDMRDIRPVVIILDPLLKEKHEPREMMALLTQVLWEQSAPIIVSGHLLWDLVQLGKKDLIEPALTNWHLYKHNHADYVLLFPKNALSPEIQARIPNRDEQVRAYGFRVGHDSGFFYQPDTEIFFNPDTYYKREIFLARNMLYPAYDIIRVVMVPNRWACMLAGHGESPYFGDRYKEYWDIEYKYRARMLSEYIKTHALDDRRQEHEFIERGDNDIVALEKMTREHRDIKNVIVAKSGSITGIDFYDFSKLLAVFSDIRTEFLTYYSCKPAYNREFIAHVLRTLDAKFITCSMGVNELPVRGLLLENLKMGVGPKGLAPEFAYSVTRCFETMRKEFDACTDLSGLSPEWGHKFCQKVLEHAVQRPVIKSNHQPFVWLPTTKKFSPITMDPQVLVLADDTRDNIRLEVPAESAVIVGHDCKKPLLLKKGAFLVSSKMPELVPKCIHEGLLCIDPAITHEFELIELDGLQEDFTDVDRTIVQVMGTYNLCAGKTIQITSLLAHSTAGKTRDYGTVYVTINTKTYDKTLRLGYFIDNKLYERYFSQREIIEKI